MKSKERFQSIINGKIADRFPMWYGGDEKTTEQIKEYLGAKDEDDALYNKIGIDFKTFRPKYIGKEFKKNDDGSWDTVWGIKRGGYFGGQALNHPLEKAETVNDINKYKFPNPDEWDVVISDEEYEKAKDYCIIGGAWAPFFNDATELLGMEKFFVDMFFNPELINAVLEKCFEFYYEQSYKMFEKNPNKIDILFFGNDFGTQRGLMMSPDMWRRFFKKYIIKMAELAHKNNAKAALHSCGDIHEIIPDLIDAGIDILNPIQVNAENMNPEKLKREYGKDLIFFGGIDINILAKGSEELVRKETRKIIDILGRDGRYIVAASHDYLLPEIPAKNIVAMYDEAKRFV